MLVSEETQPWDDEPEPNVGDMGLAGGMLIVAGLLSIIILVWAIIGAIFVVGAVPNAVLFIFGLWLMAGAVVRIVEVYGG